MNHRVWVLGAVVLGVVGCLHQQFRPQGEEEAAREKYDVKTVGDVTSVANADPVQVSGIGVVDGLEGTGGDTTPSGFRTVLLEYLQKRGVENAKEYLASPNRSLVLVSGLIPAGARKGELVDVDVSLPPQSMTTSLRGGYLRECYLYNYDSAQNLLTSYKGADRLFQGHALVRAEGPLLLGFGDGDESASLKQGRVWGGGRCRIDRPLYLVLNEDQQQARIAGAVADRINEAFHGTYRDPLGGQLAVARDKTVVTLNVPPQYRLNLPRYLRVVRLAPLREGKSAAGGPGTYRKQLEDHLLKPEQCVTTALRLEALGKDSVPALKAGLQSEHPLVRFAAAESLAYLGSTAGAEELARLVEQQPMLKAYSLTALASLNEGAHHTQLCELLASPNAETRYGAFRALRALDERDQVVQGERVNNSFWLHRVAPNAPPLVHLSTSRRAEIVLFGDEITLVPPFTLRAGEFAVTAGPEDRWCTISRVFVTKAASPAGGVGSERRQCPLRLEDVIRTMANMGGMYPEVVEVLRQAGQCRSLTSHVAVDALPQAPTVQALARAGKVKKDPTTAGDEELVLLKTDEEIINARGDFGATPTLFEKGVTQRRRTSDEDALLRDKPKADAAATAHKKN